MKPSCMTDPIQIHMEGLRPLIVRPSETELVIQTFTGQVLVHFTNCPVEPRQAKKAKAKAEPAKFVTEIRLEDDGRVISPGEVAELPVTVNEEPT